MKIKLILVLSLSLVGVVANAQTQFTAKLLAGSGLDGYTDGNGNQARFGSISPICTDGRGNVYVWDGGKIRRIGLDGYVSTIASFTGEVRDVASDQAGNIWILTDSSIDRLRPDGTYEKIADGVGRAIAVSNSGTVYFVSSRDNNNSTDDNKLFKLADDRKVEWLAGAGNPGNVDGVGRLSTFNTPVAVAVNSLGQVHLLEETVPNKWQLRIIDTNLKTSTIAIRLKNYKMAFDSNDYLYAIDELGTAIVRFSPNTYQREMIADGFAGLTDIAIYPDGSIIVADGEAHKIYRIARFQTPNPMRLSLRLYPGPSLRLDPGLTIEGHLGDVYRIESRQDIQEKWTSAVTLLLDRAPYLWVDKSASADRKFYRAVQLF